MADTTIPPPARALPALPVAVSPSALRYVGLVVALVAATVLVSRVSFVAFAALGILVLAALGYAAWRWPRTILVAVVLAPLIDRYLIGILLPSRLDIWTRFFSESLLAVAAIVISVRAVRAGTFVQAFRHPVTIGVGALVVISVCSMLVNAVPPVVAAAGTMFTLDAIALFFLARMVGFDRRQMSMAVGVFVGFVVLSALIAIAQAVLGPQILGFAVVAGRFGESIRVTSFLVDPGLFGAVVGIAAAFSLFLIYRTDDRRLRWAAAAASFVLVLALLLSFSRGGWLGMIVGFGAVALILDRRVFVAAVITAALAYGTASVMPRNLLPATQAEQEAAAEEEDPGDIFSSTLRRTAAISEGRDLRTMFIVNGLPILRDHPVVGVGPGRYGGAAAHIFRTPIYRQYDTHLLFWNDRQTTVDDFWLHLVVELGVLGLLAYLAVFGYLAVTLLRAARRAHRERFVLLAGFLSALAILTVNGITSMLLEGNTASFALWFFLGLGTLIAGRAVEETPAVPVAAAGRQPAP